MTKPVLFVTNHAPPFRRGAFAKLHEREDVTFALVGGDVRHGGGAGTKAGAFPVLQVRERDVYKLAADQREHHVLALVQRGERPDAERRRVVGDEQDRLAHRSASS